MVQRLQQGGMPTLDISRIEPAQVCSSSSWCMCLMLTQGIPLRLSVHILQDAPAQTSPASLGTFAAGIPGAVRAAGSSWLRG